MGHFVSGDSRRKLSYEIICEIICET